MTTPTSKDPYGTKPLQIIPGNDWVTLNGEPVIRGREDQACDSFPSGQALRIAKELNAAYALDRGHLSSSKEVTPEIIEAGNAMASVLIGLLGEKSDTAKAWRAALKDAGK